MEEKKIEMQEIWNRLSMINVNEFTEKKSNGSYELTYLSWASAWELLLQNYPDSTYEIHEWDNRPYFYDDRLGYLVKTSVTVGGNTRTMILPVMDSSNKAMFNHPYTYKTRNGEKTVEAATMFDINTNIMRCLVKTIALFGLGLYVYRGEDLPFAEAEKKKNEVANKRKEAFKEIPNIKSQDDIKAIRAKYPELADDDEFRTALMEKGREFMQSTWA